VRPDSIGEALASRKADFVFLVRAGLLRGMEFPGAHAPTERSATRLAQLLPIGKYDGQAGHYRKLGAQPTALLHMETLESRWLAGRTQKEEPDAVRYGLRPCLCLEQNAKRGMGCGAKPHAQHHHNPETPCRPWLRIYARPLQESSTTSQRTAVYVTRTYPHQAEEPHPATDWWQGTLRLTLAQAGISYKLIVFFAHK